MAREATAPVVNASQAKRRRPTPLRTTLLAQISSKKGLGSSQVDLSKQMRRVSSAAGAKDKSKEVAGARNRVDDAENEVNAQPTEAPFPDPFQQAFHDQQAAASNESSMLSNYSNSSNDGTVIRYENDPCVTPPYKALSAENRALARRVDSLEIEKAHLQQTRYIEVEHHRRANQNLAEKSHAFMTEMTYWKEQASLWMGDAEMWKNDAGMWKAQAIDRDGEVQRLRAKMQELMGEDGRFE